MKKTIVFLLLFSAFIVVQATMFTDTGPVQSGYEQMDVQTSELIKVIELTVEIAEAPLFLPITTIEVMEYSLITKTSEEVMILREYDYTLRKTPLNKEKEMRTTLNRSTKGKDFQQITQRGPPRTTPGSLQII